MSIIKDWKKVNKTGNANGTYQTCHAVKFFDGISEFGNISFIHPCSKILQQ
jgi:hypothetical protein